MSSKEPGLIYTVIFTFIVCFIFVFFLSLTNVATAPIVQRNEEISQKLAILAAMGVTDINAASTLEEIEKRFENIDIRQEGDIALYQAEVNGVQVVAKEFAGPGLWGTIYGAIGITADGGRITGFEIVTHNETPGLGGRIEEQWFTEQLNGERLVGGRVTMTGRRGIGDDDPDNGEIDGVSGATRTSESIEIIINNEINNLLSIL